MKSTIPEIRKSGFSWPGKEKLREKEGRVFDASAKCLKKGELALFNLCTYFHNKSGAKITSTFPLLRFIHKIFFFLVFNRVANSLIINLSC
jgi:hypothetical protein